MAGHAGLLLDEARLVARELVRAAVSPVEQWHAALEDAAALTFHARRPDLAQARLKPLHVALARTLAEPDRAPALAAAFAQTHGRALNAAWTWFESGSFGYMQAWQRYLVVFRSLAAQLSQLKVIALRFAAPALAEVCSLSLAVPGSYDASQPPHALERIHSFAPLLPVIASKRRPRKLTIVSESGQRADFLLKGDEDLRQDERAMQLFGLVNALLRGARDQAGGALGITRFAVIPLSRNSGLIGWVPACDTLHALIVAHRTRHAVPPLPIRCEMTRLRELVPQPLWPSLRPLQKAEAFLRSLTVSDGMDLAHMMWRRSPHSEAWLSRRTRYTKTLAVMSMVGYVLGLGDRHPSNIMIARTTGAVVHIDFGDCFEVRPIHM